MKNKFLFGALLSGAVLVSCNVKDGLDVGVEKAPQSPVFTVAMDNGIDAATRAELVADGHKLVFGDGDLMSLYHGFVTETNETFDNAIYEGHGDEEKGLTFTTRSMVKEGEAVLVYPANLEFFSGKDLTVKLELANQTAATVENTPYVSEWLKIGTFEGIEDEDNVTAGYGRAYEVVMKRLASTLDLTLVNDGDVELPAGVSPLTVTGVSIVNKADAFASEVTITKDEANAISWKEGTQQYQKDLAKKYPIWTNQTTFNVTTKAETIKTSVVTDDVATFTVLPFANAGNETEWESAKPFNDGATVIVHTNYGTVTIESGDVVTTTGENAVFGKKNSTTGKIEYKNIEDGLNEWAYLTWYKHTAKDAFEGSMNGTYASRFLKVDYATLDMDGTHIKTSEQLIDVLTVYDALSKNEGFNTEVEFFLDGDEDKAFYMTADALAAYLKHIGKVNGMDNPVKFIPCTGDGEECEVVVLTEGGDVPVALDFKGSVKVVLDGAWTLAGEHAFNGVNCIYVPEGSTLTLNGTIQPATTQGITNVYTVGTVEGGIYVDGTVVNGTADKTTTLKFNMENHGTVEVPANSALLMNTATFTNSYYALSQEEATKAKKSGYATLLSEGQVNVYGRLASSTDGKINNYGVVTMKSATAKVYLTNNATSGADYSKSFNAAKDSENVFGSVVMFDKTGNDNVNIDPKGEQGFIKLIFPGEAEYTVTDEDLGTIANYAVLNGACVAYDALKVGEDETVQNNIKYLEVNSTLEETKIIGKYGKSTGHTFTGMWIHEGTTVNIPSGSAVDANYVYLQGYIFDAGSYWSPKAYVTYFGGSDTDKDHYAYNGSTK